MKIIIFACLFAAVSASGYASYEQAPALITQSKLINTGSSTQSRKQDGTGNYAFSYSSQAWDGGLSQKESGDGWGNKAGSYSLNVGDGRTRTVSYVADGAGFRASIKTNEPGTAAKSPAATTLDSPYAPPVAPAPLAPAYASPSYDTYASSSYDAAPLLAYASAPVAAPAYAPAQAYATPAAPAQAYAAPAAPAALPAGAPFAPLGNGPAYTGCYNGGIGCDFQGSAQEYKGYAEAFSYKNSIEHAAPAPAYAPASYAPASYANAGHGY